MLEQIMVRAAGVEPAWDFPQRIFIHTTAFAALAFAVPRYGEVCGLDYPFTLAFA